MSAPSMADWQQPAFGDRSTAQRRRILTSTRISDAPEAAQQFYSVSSCRTANRDTIMDMSHPRPAPERRNRALGGNWTTSPGLHSALHQSNTTMRDAEPMQRNIARKVVIEKIQQPKTEPRTGAVDNTVVRLTAMRVRGVGQR